MRIQLAQQRLCLETPVHASMLLARAADALDKTHVSLGTKAGQDEVQRLEPHGNWGIDGVLGGVNIDALGDAILGAKVCVKVDLGLGDDRQIRRDDNS